MDEKMKKNLMERLDYAGKYIFLYVEFMILSIVIGFAGVSVMVIAAQRWVTNSVNIIIFTCTFSAILGYVINNYMLKYWSGRWNKKRKD